MNVLVYNGPGVSQTSLAYTLSALKALLLPHFAVQTVTSAVLSSQPWPDTCALLVIPGGRDLPYVSSLAPATPQIRAYVERGGAFLGICAGAYYASRRVEWETGSAVEVAGERPLAFFDGVCRGSVYPNFAYESESGARAVAVEDLASGEVVRGMYHNGGGEFVGVGAGATATVTALAKYMEGEGEGKVAAVHCRVGKGVAVLWGAHPEYALTAEPLLSALKKRTDPLTEDEIRDSEACRWKTLRRTLTLLGLKVPGEKEDSNKSITSPLPQFLTSLFPALPTRVYDLLTTVGQATSTSTAEPRVRQEANDVFRLHPSSISASLLLSEARNRPEDPENLQLPKDIVFFRNGELPPDELTPKFSVSRYYKFLSDARVSHKTREQDGSSWGIGDLFLYGEAVTSTQTLFDRNPSFMRALPAPLLSLASHQLSGRGRGSNAWVSPEGCLQFSLLLRCKLSEFPASRLVFIQYVFALAVVEACRELLGQAGDRVRLKWPNDIYAVVDVAGEDGRMKAEKKKIGGILVSTNFSGGEVDVVIGCGLNVLNPLPTTSLSQLDPTELLMEKTIATIMVVFEGMWERFVSSRGSFESFMDLYLERWLHSDQLVTVTTVSPPVAVRIIGITPDYGLLRTMPENGQGGFIDLQPDGNSFNMMAGLIASKT
ncbi:class II aaRS and biotin synthetase [Hysterangium stoloniferum]|nr:class II aaRS and biotin synthetase [Hysterangium stoloniferum]